MTLNSPTKNVWFISLVLGILGVVGMFVAIPFVTAYAFWIVVVGFVLLVLSTVLKGF